MTTKEIVSAMTMKEQASLTSGADFWHSKAIDRLEVPSVTMSDGPHGLRKQVTTTNDHMGLNEAVEAVCFPAGCATACSFDRKVLYRLGRLLGNECRAEGVHVLLGPAVNIKRSPLCGRNFEYFSEDPMLAGDLAAAYIKGVQEEGVGVSLKHFAANNQEHERMCSSSEMEDRTLWEIYLPVFERAVKQAKPWTVMCSYNRVAGAFASEDKKLLTEILRDKWGFDGVVVSDWGAVRDRVAGLKAGLELEMPSSNNTNDQKLLEALKTGELTKEELALAAERMVSLAKKAAEGAKKPAVFDRAADHREAVRLAEECMVLLKNEQVLPLKSEDRVAILGGFAFRPRYQGGGSSHIHPHFVPDMLQLAEKYGSITFAKGFSATGDKVDQALMEEALAAAKEADRVVIVCGLPEQMESESFDRKHMKLPECQNLLVEKVCDLGKKVVVVLQNGAPVELPWADRVDGILEAYLAGEGVSEATLNLLYGKANPCGKLAESFPIRLEDNPSYLFYPGLHHKAYYGEGIFVGYRYYEKKKMPVRFPFGHGLSYTTFAYSDLQLSSSVIRPEEEITVTLRVKNTGTMAGKEAVQLYVSDHTETYHRPEKELKGFDAVSLQPGEEKMLTFNLAWRDFACYSEELGDYYAPNGAYEILIGASSADIRLFCGVTVAESPALPLVIGMDTMIGELLSDPRTNNFVKEALTPKLSVLTGDAGDGFDEMVEAMIRDMPLRSLRSFVGLSNEELDGLIAELSALV